LCAGVSIEAQLREKLRKIEAMFAGAGTAQNSAACRRGNLTVSYIETSPLLVVSFIDTTHMIRGFKNEATQAVFNGESPKGFPSNLLKVARRKLRYLNAAAELGDLRAPPGNRLEALKGDRAGQHSIRINDQFRICFVWTREGPTGVEITDYH
jgi:proteic killer suppression protein